MPHAIRPIRPLAVLLTAALCLPALRTAAQTVTLPTCGEPASAAAYVPETDTLLLTVERLLELGVENSLRLRADRLHEEASGDRTRTARTERLPEVNVGLKGGFVGQPVVFEHGLSDATYPDAPDWSQNYAIDIVQPLYEGGRIRGSIRRAEIEERIARLGTEADCAEVKLELLRQYMNLFGLWKECDVLHRNIEESERRLKDIRQMKTEGLITNNDVLRSEMRLTDDRLSLREAIDNARIASQQLDIWMGIDEGTIILPDTTLLHLAVEPTPYEAYVDAACENDPSLRVLRAQTDLARNEVRLARHLLSDRLALRGQRPGASDRTHASGPLQQQLEHRTLYLLPALGALPQPPQGAGAATLRRTGAQCRGAAAPAGPHDGAHGLPAPRGGDRTGPGP